MKQNKLRRKRVFRYAVLFFIMLILFVGLIAGPIVGGKKIPASVTAKLSDYFLVQPTGQNNDDTAGHTQTGTGAPKYSGIYTPSSSAASSATSTVEAKMRLF